MGYGVTGVVNIPVSETFALRASGFYRSDGGYHRLDRQQPDPGAAGPERQHRRRHAGRGRHQWQPKSQAAASRALFEPSENVLTRPDRHYSRTSTATTRTLSRWTRRRSSRFTAGCVASRYHNEPTDIEYRVYSATLDWDFGGVTLQSVTSYSEFSRTSSATSPRSTGLHGTRTAQLADLRLQHSGHGRQLLSGVLEPDHGHRQVHAGIPPRLAGERPVRVAARRLLHGRGFAIIPRISSRSSPARTSRAPAYPSTRTSASIPPTRSSHVFGNATWHMTDTLRPLVRRALERKRPGCLAERLDRLCRSCRTASIERTLTT